MKYLMLLFYPHTRLMGANHTDTIHMLLHRDTEIWKLDQFSYGDVDFYNSDHKVTCTQCKYNRIAKRIWMKAETWPANLGNTREEALEMATNYKEPEEL